MIRLALFLCLALTVPASAQNRSPRFADYPEKNVVHTKVVRLPLTKEIEEDDYLLRRYDSIGESNTANFAGRYFLVIFGCGSSCVNAGIVEAATGTIIDVPFSISGWREVHSKFRGVEFRHNSRLLVFNGQLNEEGDMGRHYYVLENGALKFVATEKVPSGNFMKPAR